MSKVKGENVIVYFYDNAEWKMYACALSASLTVTTEILETSEVGAGTFATFRPTKDSFEGSLSGLVTLNLPTSLVLSDLRAKQLAHTKLLMRFQRTDNNGNTYTDEGSFYITKSTDEGAMGSMNSFSVDLKGTGRLSQGINTPPTPITMVNFKYGYTNADTTGAALTEAQYIASVDAVFTAVQELTGTFTAGQPLVVGEFLNPTDKVLFIQVPSTEAAFTTWSELGNQFQQNLRIDQAFAGSNIWFKSTRGGQTIYLTRYQTAFFGNITLTR